MSMNDIVQSIPKSNEKKYFDIFPKGKTKSSFYFVAMPENANLNEQINNGYKYKQEQPNFMKERSSDPNTSLNLHKDALTSDSFIVENTNRAVFDINREFY
jgi:hypothetical protein